jgi:hypothetical protein
MRIIVENWPLINAYLGFDRLDTVAQAQAVNLLYDRLWVHYNLFQPVMRTVEKTVISAPGQPTKLKRRYDQPRTSFERLCATMPSPQSGAAN